MKELSAKISDSRAELVFDHPFFGAIVLRLELKEREDVETMAVDGKTIFYNPAFANTLTAKELTGVFVHEAMHVIFLHHTRENGRDHLLWNIACDYAINQIILRNGFELPSMRLHDSKFDEMSAEEIYEALVEQGGGGQKGQEGQGNCIVIGGESLKPLDDVQVPATEPERQEAEQEAKELANTAITAAREAGKMPAGLEQVLGSAHEEQVHWQDQLRDWLDNWFNGDQVWHRPNKRLLDTMYLPHFEQDPAGDIVLAIDTSGSVSQEELDVFATELHAIVRENHIEKLDILWIDTKVARHQVFMAYDELDLKPAGGGGTRFEPAFDWVREQEVTPNALIYFTDGECNWPEEVTDYPVIWAITSDRIEAPWGQTLHLKF